MSTNLTNQIKFTMGKLKKLVFKDAQELANAVAEALVGQLTQPPVIEKPEPGKEGTTFVKNTQSFDIPEGVQSISTGIDLTGAIVGLQNFVDSEPSVIYTAYSGPVAFFNKETDTGNYKLVVTTYTLKTDE